jgi:hypothetical protein
MANDIQNSRLMDRDVQVILDIYKHRYLSVSQITQLRFPSIQTARRRLRVLTADDYIDGFTAPGTPETIYYLEHKGAEIVASYLQVPIDSLKWIKSTRTPKDYYFLRHFLKANDFRIALTQAVNLTNTGVKLLGYIPEYYGEKTDKGGAVKYIRDVVCDMHDQSVIIHHTPDSVFALEKEGKAALFFLEVDRGTEVLTNPEKGFLKCLHFYLNYWVSGKYKRYSDDFKCEPFRNFRTLFVTTSQTRIDNMRQAAKDIHVEPSQVKRFIWLATEERLNKDSVFQPIWQSADIADSNYYRIG